MSTLRVLDKDGNWVDIPTIVGPVGPVGPTGETGPGVSSGGSTGQILRKKSGDDFDTEWVTPTDMDLYYTKEEADDLINSKISTTFKYKGTKASYAAIQAVTNPAVGDVWNDASTDHNYVWNGSTWDKLAGTVDMSNYYTMDEAEDMVDSKLAAVPINDLIHYKGHVSSLEDLPSLGQPSADAIAPIYSARAIPDFSNTPSATVKNNCLNRAGSNPYYIAYGYGTSVSVIGVPNPGIIDGVFPYSVSTNDWCDMAVHVNASEEYPVSYYPNGGTTCGIAYDDGTSGATTSGTYVTIKKPAWLVIGRTYNQSTVNYFITNISKSWKLKFPIATKYSSGSSNLYADMTSYETYRQTSNGIYYAEGYILLTTDSNGKFTYYTGSPQAHKNDMYSVGSMRELYRCNEKPEWEKWSDFKEFQVTEMTEDDYLELSDKNAFDMYVLDRIVEVTETTNLLLNSITGDVDLVEANISEEEALAITNEIIGGVSDE